MSTQTLTRGPWTSTDLELFSENGTRHEIVNGDLFMSKMPHFRHQETCTNISIELKTWARTIGTGRVSINPGVLFSEANDVVPDVAWISQERLDAVMDEAGHLTGAPELVVEVLSPGAQQEKRDRQSKRKLYETQGVREYWIADWRLRQVEVYRRQEGQLRLIATLLPEDTLTSPLLPGFASPIERFFT